MTNVTRRQRLILGAAFTVLAIFFVELLRTAWISDDAAITLRTVLNTVHGFGLRFNIDERVQAYTHPLWFLLLTAVTILVRNVFVAAFALPVACSLAVIWLILRNFGRDRWTPVLVATGLLLSKAFADFSTSGLENPLSHLLLLATVFLLPLGRDEDSKIRHHAPAPETAYRRLALFFGAIGLVYLTRPDLILLVLPLALFVGFEHRGQPRVLIAALGTAVAPVVLWTAFSLLYYGFPFPNTAYAKLETGVSRLALMAQGTRYFARTLVTDPITLPMIALGLAASWRSAIGRCLAAGILLYGGYILYIGGDFMEGRFFTAPLLMAAICLCLASWSGWEMAAWGGVLGVLGLLGLQGTLLAGRDYQTPFIGDDGIADERGYYYQKYGLLTADLHIFATPDWSERDRTVIPFCGGLGFASLLGGPGVHALDFCAVADPLLAHLPAENSLKWRIGHFERQIPTGYVESLKAGDNQIVEPQTHAYYDVIRTITRGPLLSAERLQDIVSINLGQVPRPPDALYRFGR